MELSNKRHPYVPYCTIHLGASRCILLPSATTSYTHPAALHAGCLLAALGAPTCAWFAGCEFLCCIGVLGHPQLQAPGHWGAPFCTDPPPGARAGNRSWREGEPTAPCCCWSNGRAAVRWEPGGVAIFALVGFTWPLRHQFDSPHQKPSLCDGCSVASVKQVVSFAYYWLISCYVLLLLQIHLWRICKHRE